MREHIQGLITRLSIYNQKLDKIASFADKKWVFIDENSNQQTYIFKRDGRLIMSLSGKVKDGTWEYLPEAESILIDRIQDKILLNHAFFDEAVMILKYDGASNNDLFILADQKKIPDLDVLNHLKNKLKPDPKKEPKKQIYQKGRVHEYKLENGDTVNIFQRDWEFFFRTGDNVLINKLYPDDGEYFTDERKFKLTVKKGKIQNYSCYHKFLTSNNKKIIVESKLSFNIQIGDRVFNDEMDPLKSGKYGIELLRQIKVEDGVIVKFSLF